MTDWNAEAALRVQYINWRVDNNALPSLERWALGRGVFATTPEAIMKVFRETGVLFYCDDLPQKPSVMSYEDWLVDIKMTPWIKRRNMALRELI